MFTDPQVSGGLDRIADLLHNLVQEQQRTNALLEQQLGASSPSARYTEMYTEE